MSRRPFPAVVAALLAAVPALASSSGPQVRPHSVKASRFAVSAPARSLPPATPRAGDNRPALWLRENEALPKAQNPIPSGQRDGAVQSGPVGGPVMPPPIQNFDGNSSLENFNAFGFRVLPPDTNGAAGVSQYVQTTNLLVRVWNKTGTPLTAPFKMSSLFAPLSPSICATDDDGDPIVVYDQMADRWLLSQFAFSGPFADVAPYHECVAISVTGDATGAWYLYDFETPGLKFPDYPKFGVWPDAYYMTTNQFLGGGPFDGAGAFAFDRDKMLIGDPDAGMIYFDLDLASHPEGIGGMLPASVDGRMPPAPGAPNVFSYFIATEFGDASDGLRLFDFHADFDDPPSSTFTERPESPLAVAAFDPSTPAGLDDILQPPPAANDAALDAIGDRLMFRLAYRNFGTHESLVVTHTVNVGPDITLGGYQAAPRYYELQRSGGGWSVAEQGTYAPDTDNRWMGSVAQDAQGNLALGYSVSSLTTFPSIRYAGRLTTDPPNTLGQGETALIAGTGVQTSTASRWGDYSAMTVDPVDDCTFWYTQEYYTAASQASSPAGWVTRVGSFMFPGCAAPATGSISGVITDCDEGTPIADAVVSLNNGYVRVADGSGVYSMDPVPPGNYTATVTRNGYLVGGGPVTVTEGGATTADFCLIGTPVFETVGFTLEAESCQPPNGAPDPGELVTYAYCLRNDGGGATSNLVITLLPGGGVISPSGPMDYGVVAPGVIRCRDFIFTVDPFLACGGEITATFQLRDGPEDLGTRVETLRTGDLTTAESENFDGVTAPALPAGWSTNGTGTTLWVTTTTTPDTAPNAAFAADTQVSIDKRLESPIFAVASASAQLTFRNSYDLEEGWDGGVLEMSVDGGPFTEITAAGGSFVVGGYNAFINPFAASALAGQLAWTGNSGGYITTTVDLPESAAGHDVVLRWRLVSDDLFTDVGWWVDTMTFSEAVCCWAPAPVSLGADTNAATGTVSNLNGVIEPGETFLIKPAYFNGGPAAVNQLGLLSNFTGPGSGAMYTILDGTADYGVIDPNETNDCFDPMADCPVLSIADPPSRPLHWDASVQEEPQLSLTTGAANLRTWVLHVGESFLDVPVSLNFYSFIETIFHKGVTGGCGGSNYCPGNNVTRAQMAVFLLKSKFGAGYLPPPCTGVFTDVPCPSQFADWIEELAAQGITAGCGGTNYCPNDPVLRQQMAVFLLKTLEGSGYVPPACTGVFNDVACPANPFAPWIEELADRAITGGCGVDIYCPTNPNTRGQMAVFLTKTFGLQLYGP